VGGAVVFELFRDQESITIEIDKWIISSTEPLIIEFTRSVGDPGILEVADEIVLNLSGQEWFDFQMTLTREDGQQDPGYVKFINPGAVQNFDQLGGDVRFETLTTTDTSLAFTDTDGFGVPAGSIVDAPINQVMFTGIQIDMSGVPDGGKFRLIQIPEPAGVLLLSSGLLVWSFKRVRRDSMRER
jgi:hypothetical protein